MRMRIWFVLALRKWEHSCSDPPQQRVAELDQIWIRLLHGQVPGLEEFFGAFACGAGEKTVRPNPLERSVPQRSKPVHLSSQLLDADSLPVRLVTFLRATRSCSSVTLAARLSGPFYRGSFLQPLRVVGQLYGRCRRRLVQLLPAGAARRSFRRDVPDEDQSSRLAH